MPASSPRAARPAESRAGRLVRPRVSWLILSLLCAAGLAAAPATSHAQTQRAIRFESSATPRYLTFGAAPSLGCSTFTVEVRFKRTSLATVGVTASTGTGGLNAAPLITKGRGEGDNSNVDCNFFVGLDAGGRVAVDFEEGAGQTSPGLNHPMFSRTAVTDTLWHHAAVTFDGSATGTMRIYLDGVLDSTKVLGAKRLPRWDSIQHAGLATAMTSAGAAAGNFQGILDEARIWGIVRTDQQIADNWSVELLQGTGLLGRWGLNEGAGTTAGNSVAGGVNGTFTNGPLWTTDSTLPLATAAGLRLGGTNAYVTFGSAPSLGASTFTIETWFRRDGAGLPTSTGAGGLTKAIPLLTKGRGEADGSNVDMNYFLGIDSTSARLVADFEDMATGANHPVTGSTALSNGVWYHAAATFDGSTYRLYLNGVLEGSAATSAVPRYDSIQHAALGTALTSAGVADGFFNGALDEARVWTVARSQADLIAAMNSELTGPAEGLAARWGLNEDALTTVASTAGTVVNGTIIGSNWAWAAGSPFNAAPPSPPADPTGLTAAAISATRIDLAWTDNAGNESGYEVERSTTGIGGPYSLLVSLPANTTAYSNTGLSAATEYCYRVRAVNGVGGSGYAGPACATTAAPAPPADPSGLSASALSYGQVRLTWTDNSANETAFELERSTSGSGGPYTLLATLAANTVAYDDLNRDPGTEYCYRVRAVNADGASGYAGPACATTPAATAGALDLTGGTYAKFGNPASLRLPAFTLEMWLRRDGSGSGTNTGTGGISDAIPLIAKGRAEAENAYQDINYLFGIRASDGVLCADFEEGAGGSSPSLNHPVAGSTPIAAGTNTWHHVAATYDGATWKLYLDGNLDGSLVVNQPPAAACSVSVALASALNSGGTAAGYFDGALDEVRIWNFARTQSEIQATANTQLTTATPGLVARWSLDEGSGAIVNASAGTAAGGTVVGSGYAWTGPAPFNLTYSTPEAPSGLAATAPTHSLVTLSWNDNSSNETGFEVERSTTGVGGTYARIATVPPNTTSYSDVGLTPSTEYCYRVRAVNGNGPSSYDGPVCATTTAFSNTALVFGGNAYASFGSPAALQLSTYTLEMWIRRDAAGVGTNTGSGGIPDAIPLLAKGRAESETPATDINYLFGIRASDNVLCADFEEGAAGSSPSLNHPIAGSTPIDLGTWHHVAATYDGVAMKLYLDGVLDGSLDVGQPPASASTVAVSLASALTSGGAAAGYFAGAMDEVRIWNYARSGAEIQSTANAQIAVGTPGLVARWAMDEGSGAAVQGSAGTAINGTVTGASYTWGPGSPFGLAFNHEPGAPALLAPADHATNVPTSTTLTVQVSDPDGNALGVSFYGRAAAASPGPDFTIVALPDAQNYTAQLNGGTPAILNSQASWIASSRASRNIVYSVQLGDAVDHGDNSGNDIEWQRANTALSLLEDPATTGLPEGVPFGVAVGNHDQSPIGDPDGTTTYYNQYFGTSRFSAKSYYGGHYGANNDNWYQLFSASGLNFIVISLEQDPTPDAAVLAWADNLLTTHGDRRAIVVSHFLCNTGNPAGWGPQGQTTYDALKGHSNLFLMLCGHVPGEGRRQDTYAGNTVHTLLSDYQGRPNGGNGWLRFMEFSPANNEIRVRTYSPWLGQSEADADSSSQFTIPYNMSSTAPYALVGTVPGILSGSSASVPWTSLTSSTEYEWYAVANDGATSAVSPVWRFTTETLPAYALTTSADPVGGGTVVRNPDQPTYTSGTSVQLTAAPAAGHHFVDWSGDLTGAANPQTLVMDGAKSVTAHFALNVYTITASAGPGGSITPSGAVSVTHGADQAFAIAADAGYHIADVLVDGVSVGAVASHTFPAVAGPHTIAASFAINTYALTTAIDPAGGGTVVRSPDQPSYAHGSSVEVTATPGAGYHFVDWTGDLSGTTNPQTLVMDAAKSATAHFALNVYTITASAGPGGSIDPTGAVSVTHGADQAFTITPDPGYHIADVLVDDVSVGAVAGHTFPAVTGPHTIAVSFAVNMYTLSTTVEPGGGGTITREPDQPAYAHGASVSLTATPAPGYAFVGWSGDATGSTNPLSVGMDGNKAITATFALNAYALATAVEPPGSGTVARAPDQASYTHGTSVELTAAPATGYHFVDWAGDLTGTANPQSLLMDAAKSVTAHFALNVYTITASAGPGGSITPSGAVPVTHGADQSFTISADPGYHIADVLVDGVSVGAVTSHAFPAVAGDHTIAASFAINTYTITASAGPGGSITPSGAVPVTHGADQAFAIAADAGYHIADVLVDGVSVGAVASHTFPAVTGNHTIAATFAINTYTIAASAGPGGSITPSGAVSVTHGADQSFTIAADAGYHIADVLVDGVSVGAVASHTFPAVAGPHTIAASFAINTYALTTAVDPAGGGTVVRSPDQPAYDHGTSVELTAAPATGYHFVEWTGDLRGTTNPQALVMDAAKSVTAHFALNVYTITASAGPGGSITPSGAVPVTHGADQAFTITPDTGYHIADVLVDGASVGAGASHTFPAVNGDHTIAASFAINTYAVTTTVEPVAGGTVAKSPDQPAYDHGTSVELTAAPATGYHFVDWTGDLTGAANPQTLLMDAAKSVTAHFALNVYTITATAGPGGSISPSGAVPVTHGADQAFTITPDTGYHIADVLVDGVSVGAVASHTFPAVTGPHTIAASFAINTYTITASAGPGGLITPSGAVPVTHGADQGFAITPDAGHHVADVLVDGASVGAVATYTFPAVAADHTIAASFAINTYALATMPDPPSGGTVTRAPEQATYDHGASVEVTATAATGYHFVNWTGDLTGATNPQSLVMDAAKSVTAHFALNVYTITASAGPGGSISPTGVVSVTHGADQAFTIAPDAGYHVVDVLVDGVSAGAIASYTFPAVTGDHTIAASFAINTYTITATAGPGGSISPSGAVSVTHGADQSFTIGADTGYHVADVLVDGVSAGALTSYTFPAVSGDHTIAASFAINPDALSFSGTNAYVNFSNPTALQLPAFTLEMWMRRDGTGAGANTGTGGIADLVPLLAKGRAEAEDPLKDINYIMGIRSSTGVLAADFEEAAAPSPNPSLNHPVQGVTPLDVGTWYHVAATYDGSTWRLYVNGRQDAELAVGRAVASTSTVAVALASALNSTGQAAGFFQGVVDEVRVWSTARAASDIAQTINARLTDPTPGLVARWGLDEGTGTLVHSSAGTALDGTLAGTGWAWAGGAPFNLATYTVSASAGAGGAISPSGAVTVASGGSQSFTITPDACHDIADVLVDGASVGPVGTYAFTGVTSDRAIAVTFSLKSFTITASAGAGGAISPSGIVPVACGAEQSFAITPDAGYHLADVLVDGVSAGAVTSYTFPAVSGSHTIAASFAANGDALAFAGTDGYAAFGNPPELKLSAFTLEMWMRRDGAGVAASSGSGGITDIVPLIAKGRGETEDPLKDVNYIMGIRASDSVLAADFEEAAAPSPNPSLNHPVAGTTPLALGTWYHVAATYDGATWALYVNGALDAQLAVGRAPASASDVAVALASTLSSTGVPAGFFNGAVDEVRVWSAARTQSEIIGSMNSRLTGSAAGLVGRWALDEGYGTALHSTAGPTLDGALAGAGWSWSTGAPFNAPIPAAPEAPSGLLATAASPPRVTLTWTDNSANETGFEVERSTTGSGGPFSALGSVAANATSYTDSSLAGSTEYCYRVRAVNGIGSSGYADPACATTPGTATSALAFGGGTYVTFGDPDALDLAQFTIECWFRRDGAGTTTSTGSGGVTDAIPLVTHGTSQSDGSNLDGNYFLGIKNGTGVLCADFEEGAGGSSPGLNHPVLGVTPIVNGTWYHAAATYDGGTWNLYLNGNLEAQLYVGQPVQSGSIQHAGLATSLTSTGTPQGYFVGALDEVRVWSVARPQADLQATINTQIATAMPNLAARWSLDEGSGTAVGGSAGTTVNGTITGAAYTWTAPAPFNASFTLPADPTGLTAVAMTHTRIDLSWADNATNETAYQVERSTTGSGGPFALLATRPAGSTSYSDVPLSPSTEYCYRVRAMNGIGPSGYTAVACASTPATSSAGLDLTGGSYASFGSPSALQLSTFTIEMWLRRDGAGSGTNTGSGGIADAIPLLAKGRAEAEDSLKDVNYLFGIRASDGVLCADFEEGPRGVSPSLNHPVAGSTSIPTGSWHHVAATYDGAAWNLYLDGVLDGTLYVGQPVASTSTVAVALASALNSGGTAAGYFDGMVDEVRVWSVARTEAEIQATANLQISTPTPGLVARWSLDEGSGTAISGSAGTSIAGTIIGAPSDYAWAPGAPFDLAFNHAPTAPVVSWPDHNASGVSLSPPLEVTVADPDGASLDVTYYGRAQGGSAGPDFWVIGLPDAQNYTGQLNGGTPAILQSQTGWIAANRAARNIAFAMQYGDLAENGDNGGNDVEWQRANSAMVLLEDPATTGLPQGVPYGIAVGNHDQSPNGDPNGTTTFYNQYFGTSRFGSRSYYGGHYGSNNDNWYDLFTAGGMDFIVFSLEYATTPDAAVLTWADNLLTTYSGRRAILVSHNLIGTGNPGSWTTQGQAVYNALKGHANLFLMVCGHSAGEGRRQDTYNGNTVTTLLSDYQSRANGGDGWLRIMEFSPANNVIRVRTYSPYNGQYEADADSSSQFSINYAMSSAAAFAQIGTVYGVASGGLASLTWPNRTPATPYEWYVTVTDGIATVTGPTWRFTTASPPTYALAVTADDAAGGAVAKSPDRPAYPEESVVTLTAVPAAGWEFRGWCGDASGTANPITVSIAGDRRIHALFNQAGAPMVDVIAPNGSEAVPVGTATDLRWIAADPEGIDAVDLYLSRTGPSGPYETIASGVPNTGSYTWTVTGALSGNAYLKVVAHNPAGPGALSGWDVSAASFSITGTPTGVEGEAATQFVVRPAAPNPMSDHVSLHFSLPQAAPVRIDIIDVQGRVVSTLANRVFPRGWHDATWNGRGPHGNAATGVYFLRLKTPDRVVTRRIVLVR